MKTKHNTTNAESFTVPVPHVPTAVLPASLLAGLKYFAIYPFACGKDGAILSDEDRVTGASVWSKLKVVIGGEPGLVSRVSALLLLQTGGRADIARSRYFGGSLSFVTLPVGVLLEVC